MEPRGQASTDAFRVHLHSADAQSANSTSRKRRFLHFAPSSAAAFSLLAIALALLGMFHFLARLQPLDQHAPEFISLMLLAGILYLTNSYIVLRYKNRPSGLLAILSATGVFRLFFLPLSPTLSQDVYRYRWEGRIVRAHINPYTVYPALPGLSWAQDPEHPVETGKTTSTFYPPISGVPFPGFTR